MLNRKYFICYCIGFLSVIVSGASSCATVQENAASMLPDSQIDMSTDDNNPVATPRLFSITGTSFAPTINPTPLPTTPVPIAQPPTITPMSTLTIEQEGELLSLLMKNNGGCDLPCWWGVTPGATSEEEVHAMFISKVFDSWGRSPDYGDVGLGYPRSDSTYYYRDVIVRFWIKDDLINFIVVDARPLSEEVRPIFNKDWKSFSPDKMLDRYGTPSHIGFREVEQAPYYSLVLSYDSLGIEVGYIIPFEVLNNGNKKVCFDSEIYSISLVLYSPEESGKAPVGIISEHLDNYISWESTTGTDLTAFQQLFEDSHSSPCVEIEVK